MKVLPLKFLKCLFDDYNMTSFYQVLRYSDVSWLRYFNEQSRPFLFPTHALAIYQYCMPDKCTCCNVVIYFVNMNKQDWLL